MTHNQSQGSQEAFRSHKKFEIWEIQTKWIDICKSWDFKLIQEVSLSVFEKSVVKSKALSRWRCSSMTETLGLECSDFLSRDWNRWICQNRTRKHPDTKLSKRLKSWKSVGKWHGLVQKMPQSRSHQCVHCYRLWPPHELHCSGSQTGPVTVKMISIRHENGIIMDQHFDEFSQLHKQISKLNPVLTFDLTMSRHN